MKAPGACFGSSTTTFRTSFFDLGAKRGSVLGTLLALKIDKKIDPKSDCSKGRSKIAPRPPKTLPRRPPDPQDPPGPPKMLSRTPQDAPGCPQKAFPSTWPSSLFRKNRKFEIVERCRKKVDYVHPRWSLDTIPRKNRKSFATVEPLRVAAVVARSALQ